MTGRVTGGFQSGIPVVTIVIQGKGFQFLIDTGFNGQMMLPYNLIQDLNLTPISVTEYATASGDSFRTYTFVAEIQWFNTRRKVSVISGHEGVSLIGMELIHDCTLIVERYKNYVLLTK